MEINNRTNLNPDYIYRVNETKKIGTIPRKLIDTKVKSKEVNKPMTRVLEKPSGNNGYALIDTIMIAVVICIMLIIFFGIKSIIG